MTANSDTSTFAATDIPAALVLLTRLPMPALPSEAFNRSAHATWAYPLVGSVLGVLAALVWWITGLFDLSPLLQAGLTLAALTLMTGALHEDGLADTADGLWGGHDTARRLEIMKDSRIGSYGVLALVFCIGLRWFGLAEAGIAALIAAATLSRAVLPAMMAIGPYARTDGLARSVGTPPQHSATVALAIGAGVAWACVGFFAALVLVLLAGGVAVGMHRLAKRKINGITGDILGATQQICEITLLVALTTLT